jgi:hypothetical protein
MGDEIAPFHGNDKHLAATAIDTMEYAYLEGQDGAFIEIRNGFDVDGLKISSELADGTILTAHEPFGCDTQSTLPPNFSSCSCARAFPSSCLRPSP